MENAKYLKVEVAVRYWDGAEINGESHEDGATAPFKNEDLWVPVVDLDNGSIVDWPEGVTAKFHFKVCDAGVYHLLDNEKKVIASRFDNYVPAGLCHGDEGYGDYIIFSVDESGKIEGYRNNVDFSEFTVA